MKITRNILIESLAGYEVLHQPTRKGVFNAVFTARGSGQLAHEIGKNSRALFIGHTEDAIGFLDRNPRAQAIVLVNKADEAEQLMNYPEKACVVLVGDEFDRALSTCEDTIARYSLWEDAMKNALLNDGDYQNILTLSEEILGNFVSISDSAFRLLAYTRNIPIDNPVAQALIEHGHHIQETVDLFKRNGLDKIWSKQNGLSVNRDSIVEATGTIDYVFKMRGEYFTHVVMHCNNRLISEGLIDAFSIMTEHLAYYVRRDWHTQQRVGPEYGKTLINLISGKLRNSATANEEIRLAHINDKARFRLYALSFKDEQLAEKNQGTSYFLYRLLDQIPEEKAVTYDGKVILFHELGLSDENLDAQIVTFQNAYGGICGVSGVVDSVYDVPFAYQQACYALKKCSSPETSMSLLPIAPRRNRICRFEDLYPEFLLMSHKDDRLVAFCLRHSTTMRIKRDDEANGTDNLITLHAYLAGERKATNVSKQLHMHRNTLVYKIESMQKRYNLDLESASKRQALIIEFALIDTIGIDLIGLP